METLLFRGVPGSRQSQPMLPDETAARAAKKAFIDDLVKGEGGRRYVVSTAPATSGYTVVVNLDLLRDALVREGLARRFGT
jgi:hypothetical protein